MMGRRSLALLLATTRGIGGKSVVRVLTRNDLLGRSADEFLGLAPEVWREEYKLSQTASLALANRLSSRSELELLERRMAGLGVSWVTTADSHYPSKIEQFDSQPPGVLFLYGNQQLLGRTSACILASRGAPPAALDLIESIAEERVLSGQVIVSGHDRPAYQRSAVVPLRWGAPRVLVLDRGLFQALGEDLKQEPFRAARLWRYQFDPVVDLVISPFAPDAKFVGINNRVRDRIVAAMSDEIDVAFVEPGGNMDALARRALELGRRVRVSDLSLEYRTYRDLGAEVLKA